MAKRTGGGKGDPDMRRLLAAAVIEYGTRRVVGPYVLTIPRRSLRLVSTGGRLAEYELPGGGVVVTYTPPRETPKPKR
jgi:hypothetical protein